MKSKLIGNSIFFLLIFLCVSIDFYRVFMEILDPENFAKQACNIKNSNCIATFLFSKKILNYINNQCMDEPHEPAFSIIFFMIKISITFYFILIFSFAGIIRKNARKLLILQNKDCSSYFYYLKSIFPKLIYSLISILLGLYFCGVFSDPEKFHRNNVIGEDIVCAAIFIIFGSIVWNFIIFSSYRAIAKISSFKFGNN